jgi:hypothetical protein
MPTPVKKTGKNGKGQFDGSVPGPGRPKGRKNKFTSLKDEFVKVYEDGGITALHKLMNDNPRDFFGLMRDLYPKELKQTIESHSTIETTGLSDTLALAEEAAAQGNVVPLRKSGT